MGEPENIPHNSLYRVWFRIPDGNDTVIDFLDVYELSLVLALERAHITLKARNRIYEITSVSNLSDDNLNGVRRTVKVCCDAAGDLTTALMQFVTSIGDGESFKALKDMSISDKIKFAKRLISIRDQR